METWSVHQLYREAEPWLGPETASRLRKYAQALMDSGLPVVFSLGHLSRMTHVSYRTLRDTVDRRRESANYRMFAVGKRSGGLRFIHAVSGELLSVQRFINREILQNATPHPAAFAFHSGGGIRACAARHCSAQWLFHFDLSDFFHHITEADAYRVFAQLGYRSLLAFEMARICTTTRLPRHLTRLLWDRRPSRYEEPLPYVHAPGLVGVLPQGAPTSPMLSNLASTELDVKLSAFAHANGFTYTRYADDITLSAVALPANWSVAKVQRSVIGIIRRTGFRENRRKLHVARPGSRKIVLGLLVDGDQPRISRATYHRIDRHLYAAERFGIPETAAHEGFDSAYGFHNHLAGLISFVKDVDRERWDEFAARLSRIEPPWKSYLQ